MVTEGRHNLAGRLYQMLESAFLCRLTKGLDLPVAEIPKRRVDRLVDRPVIGVVMGTASPEVLHESSTGSEVLLRPLPRNGQSTSDV